MPIQCKASGAWKTISSVDDCYVKVSGSWKKCSQVYVKVNDAWKPCYPSTKTATGPNFGSPITLTNVEVGSLITLTGKFDSSFNTANNGVVQPGRASFSASGASFETSENNGTYYGVHITGHPQAGGGAQYSWFTLGEEPSMKVGPRSTNYKIVLKATSSTVKISVSKIGDYTGNIKSITCSVFYTGF
jgi:hypothetical protein